MVSAQGQLEMEVKFIREDMNLSFIIWLVCEVGFRGRDKFIHEAMHESVQTACSYKVICNFIHEDLNVRLIMWLVQ